MQGNTAKFSPCRTYRYSLWRDLNLLQTEQPGYVMFIGLNPSTADETLNDPTIKRCMSFTESWGYGQMCMTNLFAFRQTDPALMKKADKPVGEDNDKYLIELAQNAGLVVAAWGTHGVHLNRAVAVKNLIPNLHYLRLTKDGHPEHPLYLPGNLTPRKWV